MTQFYAYPPLFISTPPFPLGKWLSCTNLFQYQWLFQTWLISSIGMPLVSGKKKKMNIDMSRTKKAKKMNNPNFKWQSIVKKTWATMNVNNMFTETFTLCAAERISKGKISLGTNQPRGPHDHAKPATYMQMNSTTTIAYHLGNSPGSPLTPNLAPIAAATTA